RASHRKNGARGGERPRNLARCARGSRFAQGRREALAQADSGSASTELQARAPAAAARAGRANGRRASSSGRPQGVATAEPQSTRGAASPACVVEVARSRERCSAASFALECGRNSSKRTEIAKAARTAPLGRALRFVVSFFFAFDRGERDAGDRRKAARTHEDIASVYALRSHQFHRRTLRFALACEDAFEALELLRGQAGLQGAQHPFVRTLLVLHPFRKVRIRPGEPHESARGARVGPCVLADLAPLLFDEHI